MITLECESCGKENDPERSYCSSCGVPLAYSDAPASSEEVDASDQMTDQHSDTTQAPSTTSSSSDKNGVAAEDTDQSESSETTTCPECGSVQSSDTNFCSRCGTQIKSNGPTEQDQDQSSSDGQPDVWLDIADTTVNVVSGEPMGRELRRVIADASSREEALYISKEHLEFEINNQVLVRDLNSLNGTSLNGSELPQNEYQEVHDGDELVISIFEATVHVQYPDHGATEQQVEHSTEQTDESADSPNEADAESTLKLLNTDKTKVAYELRDGETIGRGEKADVTLDEPPTVSRVHATVRETEQGWTLSDTSSNQSFIRESTTEEWISVNDELIALSDGSQVAFGGREELIVLDVQF